ncbi:MAG: response regulator transcription factor [Cyanobacteria bacterium P01_G01_bin.19]
MVRILIIDDQKIVREGIKMLLSKSAEIEIIGDASNGKEGLEQIESKQPDVVLLDIDMPGISGITAAQEIKVRFPEVKIIMLSSHEDEEYVQKATESGAKGYLLKDASSKELEWSIKLVSRGYSAIKSELLEQQFANPIVKEPDLNLAESLETSTEEPATAIAVLSEDDRANLDKLELLLSTQQIETTSYSVPIQSRPKKRRRALVHGVKLSQAKKTLLSFEFRLLAFVILFCLGFLTFVALS